VFWPDFVLMVGLGILTAGFTGYLIFGPLSFRHLEDREAHEGLGGTSFAPTYWMFLLSGRYRALRDRGLDPLATPARIMLWTMAVGMVGCAIGVAMRP
jgi:hypothetical protein